jgi:putative ABC transport system permease protein
MFRNYLLTALRSFSRQRSYSLINLSGLAMGLACSIFIFLWVMDEVSYNGFHKDADRIFQVMENQTYSGGKIFTFAATPGKLAEALKQEIPEVEYAARTSWGDRLLFKYEEKSIYEEGMYADPTLFKIFTFPIINGDKENPLPDNNSVAISEKMARKYFGDEDAIGKLFRVNNEFDCKVTAVFADVPENSSIKFEYLINFDRTFRAEGNKWMHDWDSNGLQTFVKLNRATAQPAVDGKIKEFVKKRVEKSVVDLFLWPIANWRLYGNFELGKPEGGRITYVRAFSFVAIFILIIACINFMNLATARAANRSREVGIRKVVGAQRRSLILQFIGESLLMTLLSLTLALLIVHLLLPSFNEITGKHISIDYTTPLFPLSLLAILFITGLLAGSYPAFFLSGFQPSSVLKGNLTGAFTGAGLRKTLVVFQFSLSVALIVCALIVYRQINYIRTKNMGFDRQNIVFFNKHEGVDKSFESFRGELLQSPLIKYVGRSSELPMEVGSSSGAQWEGKADDDRALFPIIVTDQEFMQLAGFELVAGRYFSRDIGTDTATYIIMEETARRMGMKDPIGQTLTVWGSKGTVIGVVKDFHSANLHNALEPVIFVMKPQYTYRVFVKYEDGQADEALKMIEATHKKFESAFPFEPEFLDAAFDRQYKSDLMVGKLSAVFTAMTIFISCLGLLGLASYTTERRTKEIGVRKVLGASVTRIVAMLCRDFVVLVLFALIVGCPLAWYVMTKFLDQYKFHTDMSPWTFIITGAGIVLVALLTVSYRSIRAALGNPVKALRSE